MELSDRLRVARLFGGVSPRIQGLSRRYRKRAEGVLLLLTALVLALWARDAAEAVALSDWLRDHPPTPRIWKHALGARGLRPFEEPRLLHRYSKTLPAMLDAEGAVWATSDANWVTVFQHREDGLESSLYCADCSSPPQDWHPAGKGWEAFDPLMERLEEWGKTRKPRPKAARAATPADPREIRF